MKDKKQQLLSAALPGASLSDEGTRFLLYPDMTLEGYALLLEEDGACDSLASLKAGAARLADCGKIIVTPFGILEWL